MVVAVEGVAIEAVEENKININGNENDYDNDNGQKEKKM